MTKHQIEAIAKQKRTGNSPTDNAFRYGYAQALEDFLAIFNAWIDNNFVGDTYEGYLVPKEDFAFELKEKL